MGCFGSNGPVLTPDGECPDCGCPTFEGLSVNVCEYSSLECHTCKSRPCDESC